MLGKNRYLYIPFIIVAFVIPVIVFPVTTQYNNEMAGFLLTQGIHTDFFNLAKAIVLYFSALFFLILLIFDNKKRFPYMFLILIPVYICSFLSAYLSDFKISAFFGIFDHYEGFLTQTCYLIILVCSYALLSNTKYVYNIIKIVLWAGFTVAVFGVFQYAGLWHFAAEEPYAVTSTIGNPNYVGTYSAIILPLSLTAILIEEKPLKKAASLLIFFGAAYFLLLGSMSRAGWIAFLITVLLFFVLLKNEIKDNYIWILAAVMYGIVLFTALDIYTGNSLVNELRSMNPFTADTQKELIFENISLDGNTAKVYTNEWILNIEIAESGCSFKDETGQSIPFEFDSENKIISLGQPYQIQAFIQEKEELKWIMLKTGKKDVEFVYTQNSLKVVGFNGKLTDIFPVESVKLPFGESFASGRGYIWSRAVPLLKNAVVTGYGPDTFTYIFPQNDILGKLNYGAIWAVITKPHNWYLQTALGCGVISLICLLIFFIWYAINVIKESRNADSKTRILSYGILLSVIGYLIAGIFNDSVVSVSPVFWMLLGFGISINKLSPENTGID